MWIYLIFIACGFILNYYFGYGLGCLVYSCSVVVWFGACYFVVLGCGLGFGDVFWGLVCVKLGVLVRELFGVIFRWGVECFAVSRYFLDG